ncbi:MAG: sugar phosphate isomerase/epimerase [Opitutaceae bacterium]|jgi:sugar phosphate isomerase/epimerase|nr:sugar phosphate isomerase/epimerase [Opitutaceae bacterium]
MKPAARLAVCSWSLEPANPDDLLARLSATGIARVSLDLTPLIENPETWGAAPALLARAGVAIVSGMVRCAGEDYTTLESIRRTGGVAPDATWPANRENFRAAADLAAGLGIPLVTLHAGFLPEKKDDPAFPVMRSRLRETADLFARQGVRVGLETGQETAADLAAFLRDLAHPGVGVNFDPANMILYGKGDPVAAVGTLAPWLAQTHIKDARPAAVPGQWGEEVPAGEGAVNWPAFLAALATAGFAGDLAIEREAGTRRAADIATARDLVTRLLP